MRRDFARKKPRNSVSWYDVEYDRTLIEQSIAKQYGVLPSEQGDLRYIDWMKLVAGLMDDTPLGRIVGIRSESSPDILKNYTAEQNRIRSEWRAFQTKRQLSDMSEADLLEQMSQLEKQLAAAFSV